jgi:tRNA threonylcarbamoyladenosine biosynthesis protein TsaE
MDLSFDLAGIGEAAERFWKSQTTGTVFAFHGEMGVGKTTFIHALCDVKGVKDVVGSPTFSLVNQYEYPKLDRGEGTASGTIYHIDLYRIRDEEEAIRSGIEDVLSGGDICLVEWPDKAPGIFPEDTVHVYLSRVDNDLRRVIIGDN